MAFALPGKTLPKVGKRFHSDASTRIRAGLGPVRSLDDLDCLSQVGPFQQRCALQNGAGDRITGGEGAWDRDADPLPAAGGVERCGTFAGEVALSDTGDDRRDGFASTAVHVNQHYNAAGD